MENSEPHLLSSESILSYFVQLIPNSPELIQSLKDKATDGLWLCDSSGQRLASLSILRDLVDERRRMEEFDKTEKMFQIMVENSSDVLVIIDKEGNQRYISPSIEKITGFTPEELAKPFTEVIHPDDVHRVVSIFQALIDNPGTQLTGEYRHIHKDGQYRYFEALGNNHLDDPLINGIVVNVRDITKRKIAENQAKENEQKFRLIAENTHEAIVVTDMNLKTIYASPAVERILGYTPHAFSKLHIDQILTPASLEKVMATFAKIKSGSYQTLLNESIPPIIEVEEITKNGEHIWVALSFSLLYDEQGTPNAIISVSRDITKAKEMEATLRVKEFAMEAATVSIAIADLKRTITYVNKAMLDVWGFNHTAEVLGRPIRDFWINDSTLETVYSDLQTIGKWSGELRGLRKDRSTFYGWVNANLVKDQFGYPLCILASITDITALRNAQEEISRINQDLDQRVKLRTSELEAVNKELETFSYSISHDLQAPLRRIKGFVDMLLETRTTPLSHEEEHFLDIIATSTHEMEELINAVLSFSRLNKYELRKSKVSHHDIVQSVLQTFEPEIHKRSIQITLTPLPETFGDHGLLKMVWTNLISNAIKYTSKREYPTIEIGASIDQHWSTFFVKDNGAGFDMKYAEKLFGVFQRLHKASDFEGIGIGLANVNRIVSRHGGFCRAHGEVEVGATISFSLPKNEID